MSDTAESLADLPDDEKRSRIRQALAGCAVHAVSPSGSLDPPVSEACYRFEQFPEYLHLARQQEAVSASGLANPYFRVHDGAATDQTVIQGRTYLNYTGYNYLGLSGHPAVSEAAKAAIDRYGTSVSASRLVSGERPVHRELERALSDMTETEACLTFVSGHATNVTTIGLLCGAGDLILHDALIHTSVIQGSMLSGARRAPFPHNDPAAVDRLLAGQRQDYRRVLIVTEGVFSMDGDIPDLPALIKIKKRYKALLMVDEAHSIGVIGQKGYGIREYYGVCPDDVDLWMGTLSKAFASCGGYIAGCEALIEMLKYGASGFVYSVGMPPVSAAAALAAIRLLQSEPERVARLQQNARMFLEMARSYGLNTGYSKDSAIAPVIVGSSMRTLKLAQWLFERGIIVQPVLYPAVEEDAARLRFFLTCLHTEEQIRETVKVLKEGMEEGKSVKCEV